MRIESSEPDIETPQIVGYCACCEENVEAVERDFGFDYEYWGCKGYHVDLRMVCPACGEEVGPAQRDDEYESED